MASVGCRAPSVSAAAMRTPALSLSSSPTTLARAAGVSTWTTALATCSTMPRSGSVRNGASRSHASAPFRRA